MISVEEALGRILDLVQPLSSEVVPLAEAHGSVLATSVRAKLDQPPFDASSMDGYALRASDAVLGQDIEIIGESAAGDRFDFEVGQGQAVRIFTGAPVPRGADTVVIQENVDRRENVITIQSIDSSSRNIRSKGQDFAIGTEVPAGRKLTPATIALLASMNVDRVEVHRRPVVALIATGDELVMPGEAPSDDQIISSNNFGIAALFKSLGCQVKCLPIARDTEASLGLAFRLARGADLVVTIGGASVGERDIVRDVAQTLGLDISFYKVAMRPGKPLMAGKFGDATLIGLPGNPVSAMICAHVFLVPTIRKMHGLATGPLFRQKAKLGVDLPKNGPRAHYMRAQQISRDPLEVKPFERQDSALLSVLNEADGILVRPPHDPARKIGDDVDFIPVEF